MFFGALSQANHAVSLLFFLGLLSPGSGWWFGFHWNLPRSGVSTSEAGGCCGEGVSELETSCRHRDNVPWDAQQGLAAWGPGESGVQAGPCWRRMWSRKGFVMIHKVWSGGLVGQLTRPVEVELGHQYGYIPWL